VIILKNKNLQQYINVSWLISGLLALMATFILFASFGIYNYVRDSKLVQVELDNNAQAVSRRLSGELLLGDRGSAHSVSKQLTKEFNLSDLNFGSRLEIEKLKKTDSKIYSTVPVPFLEDRFFVQASVDKKSIMDYFIFSSMFICFVIIGVLIGTGIFIQTRYLKKHLINPIQALVEISTGEKIKSNQWPSEIQEISEKLNQSFSEREQVVYSQLARGVIHDIRTLLQSLQVATDLANEKQSESRLNNLLSVCKSKLPNLLGIINTALDGSREIKIKPLKYDLQKTLISSIETNQALSELKKVKILFKKNENELLYVHDPIQLERVFTNLIKNSIEALDESNIENKMISLSLANGNQNKIDFVIEDNGPGILFKSESILRPFKSAKPHGFGLGLFVSKKIIEAHGGKFHALNSQKLNGAKFVIELPEVSESRI